MATLAIIHGGGDSGLSWGPAATHFRELGHGPVPVDLPVEDADAGWNEYADTVAAAVRGKPNIVVVAHSLGGFTAPLVCGRVPVQRLIFPKSRRTSLRLCERGLRSPPTSCSPKTTGSSRPERRAGSCAPS